MKKQLLLLSIMVIYTVKGAFTQVSILPASALQEDHKILQRVLLDVHPGLYRYNSPEQMKANFKILENSWTVDRDEKVALRQLAQFLVKLRCGHTCINPYNFDEGLKARLYPNNSFLPFYFRIINKKIIVTETALNSTGIMPGYQILSINGVKSSVILDSLFTAVKADGMNNTNTKYKTLEISSQDAFSVFDMLYPLFFPATSNYKLEVLRFEGKKQEVYTVSGVSAVERREVIETKRQVQHSNNPWPLQIRDNHTALLTMKSWFTYKFKTNWRKLLANYFEELNAKGVENLIIDLRDNVGGDGSVIEELLRYIIKDTIKPNQNYRQVIRATSVDKALWPYFLTWADDYKKRVPEEAVKPIANGMFELVGPSSASINPRTNCFKGKVYIIINAANSSATFNFADIVSQNKVATLVGQKTGGNKLGINANRFIFLRLPNSKFIIDIPLVFNDVGYPREDGGVLPDVEIAATQKDIADGVDTETSHIFKLIAQLTSPRKNGHL